MLTLKSLAPNNDNRLKDVGNAAGEAQVFNELVDILAHKKIRVVFQPLISLVDASIIGYEALSRGPEGSALESPDALFSAATKFNLVWELEYLCRAKALEKARFMENTKAVFINVDPNIINDIRFQKGLTKEILQEYCLDTSNVIFELTEKTAIKDYKNFRKMLDNYISQGYKIAIDDTGSGYSGLKMLAQTYPHYIKVDMELVRDIDKDSLKQAMMKALHDFSVITNSKIIAEGIETAEELIELIRIGIPCGQGYYIQRPSPEFLDISPQVRQLIISRNAQKKREIYHTALSAPVGEIARQDQFFLPTAFGYQAIDYFNTNSSVMGIPVVNNAKPVGLLMKNKFLNHLATQYGVAVYTNRQIDLIMDRNPLIVDYDTPLEMVSKSALARSDENIYDYIIVTKDDKYYGITTIKHLLEKTTQLEINRAKHANPLTGLPGNIMIEEELRLLLTETESFSILYFDLDNFKAYNDVYGFENGDKLICMTAQLIQKNLADMGLGDAFFGHIGGDDFVAIVRQSPVGCLCDKIISSFDSRVSDFYTEQDKKRGFIMAKNRHGVEERFPIITLSIAVVTNRHKKYLSPAEIGEAAGMLKKQCKLTWKSCYIMD